VITEENEHTALDNVALAKKLGVECKLNYAMASGREGKPYPIGKMYNLYLDVHEAGLGKWEFNTQQMLKRIQGSEITMCPQNRRCDEGIRNLQPKSESGYEYGSCGSFGDDQEYGIDFEREMAGELFTPLQSAYELHHLKDECLTCPAFAICNGCYKTVRDLKKSEMIEESCKEMKHFMSRATALGLR
jgi:sulfatase maturation enzyme AslB (radical SAM superfamily)